MLNLTMAAFESTLKSFAPKSSFHCSNEANILKQKKKEMIVWVKHQEAMKVTNNCDKVESKF